MALRGAAMIVTNHLGIAAVHILNHLAGDFAGGMNMNLPMNTDYRLEKFRGKTKVMGNKDNGHALT
jgi:hypothetical protein